MIIKRISLSSGLQQNILALILGIITAVAYAPINLIFAPFITIPLFLCLLELNQSASWKRHFYLGFWFGFGYFMMGLYWMSMPLVVDIQRLIWFLPLTLFGLQMFLALHIGGMAVLLKLTNSKGIARCCWFAALWTATEIAVGTGPFAMPWNITSSLWSGFDPMLQSLSLLGTYGLTLITALLISLPILFIGRTANRAEIYFATLFCNVFIVLSIWGLARPSYIELTDQSSVTQLRLVQPNIPQVLAWRPEMVTEQLNKLIKLSRQTSTNTPDLIIWPETSLPVMMTEDPTLRNHISTLLNPDTYLIAGTLRLVNTSALLSNLYNSLVVYDHGGRVIRTFDKFHLVPIGEYLPLRSVIPSYFNKVATGYMDYTPGKGPTTVSAGPHPSFSPLICFEALFPGEIIASGNRPRWILNITNDAWFGKTSEPYQHVQLNRMRAIEEGLPLVRVANSGISVVYDALGHEVAKLGLGEQGILDVRLPPAVMNPTPFAQYGHAIFFVLLSMVIGTALLFHRR